MFSGVALAAMLAAGGAMAQSTGIWNTLGPAGGPVSALISIPTSRSTLYLGTPDNGVFVSSDGGSTWAAANAGLPMVTDRSLRKVDALASDGQFVFVATQAGVYFSPLSSTPGSSPNWVSMNSPVSAGTEGKAFLTYDSTSLRLFYSVALSSSTDPATIWVADLAAASAGPASVTWTSSAVPSDIGILIGAMTILPPGASTASAILVGVGAQAYQSSIFGAPALAWAGADFSGDLAKVGSLSALVYSPDYLRTYACAGGTLFSSGIQNDPNASWIQLDTSNLSTMAGFSCNALAANFSDVFGSPLVTAATNQGVLVSNDGNSFRKAAAFTVGAAANAVSVGLSGSPPSSPTAFAGGDFGVSAALVSSLAANPADNAAWQPRNGPASVTPGGSNLRLNNATVTDTAVIGATLYAAASGTGFGEVFASTDGGANWTSTGLAGFLAPEMTSPTFLAVDATNSVLYAAISDGLVAYASSGSSAGWRRVAGSTITDIKAIAAGATTLYVGTGNNGDATSGGLISLAMTATPGSSSPTVSNFAGKTVTALTLSGGKVYAAVLDETSGEVTVSSAAEASVGTPSAWTGFATGPVGTGVSQLLLVGDRLYAATKGQLLRFATAGSGWASANLDMALTLVPADGYVNGLAADNDAIYVSTRDNGVFRTLLSSNLQWTAYSGSGDTALPTPRVNTLRINGTTLYAATAGGVAVVTGLNTAVAPPTPTPTPTPEPTPTPTPGVDSGSGGGGASTLGFAALLLAAIAALGWTRPSLRRRRVKP